MRFPSLVVLAAPLASAILITAPFEGAVATKGSSLNVRWSSVVTDPTEFSLYLWNFVDYPPVYRKLIVVPTADGQATVQIPCDINDSTGWQINAINGDNVYSIYAQSSHFTINGTCTGPVGSGVGGTQSTTTPPGGPTTVTVTVTQKPSSLCTITEVIPC